MAVEETVAHFWLHRHRDSRKCFNIEFQNQGAAMQVLTEAITETLSSSLQISDAVKEGVEGIYGLSTAMADINRATDNLVKTIADIQKGNVALKLVADQLQDSVSMYQI